MVYAADHGLVQGVMDCLVQNVYEQLRAACWWFVGRYPGEYSTMAMTCLTVSQLCGYAGVEVPEGVDGYNLRSVFEGTQESVRNSVFLAYQIRCGPFVRRT